MVPCDHIIATTTTTTIYSSTHLLSKSNESMEDTPVEMNLPIPHHQDVPSYDQLIGEGH